jgi:hypothetical protein
MLVPSCQVAVLVLIFYAVSVLSQDPTQRIDPRFSFGSCARELASSIREFYTGVARSSALQYNLASSSSVFFECVSIFQEEAGIVLSYWIKKLS